MPKILRIINRFNLGGPTYNAVNLTRDLSPEFETMLVGGTHAPGEESSLFIAENAGLDPLIIGEMSREVNPLKDWSAYKKICDLIKRFRPDIVHTHASKAGLLGRMAAQACKTPVVVHTFHGHVFHSYFNPAKTAFFKQIERYLASKSSAIVAISEIQKKELSVDHRICQPEKIRVIPLGLDLERFMTGQEEKRNRFRTQYGLGENDVAVGIIGRLAPVKNHAFFLKVASLTLQSGNNNLRFVVVGDGETKSAIRQLCDELGLTWCEGKPAKGTRPQVIFTSWMKDADVALAGVEIAVLTSLNEGTPVSLIEAQAACKPVISTEAGGVANVVAHGKSGYVVSQGDIPEFARHLQELASSASQRAAFGTAGRKISIEKFGHLRLAGDMSALYHELLSVSP